VIAQSKDEAVTDRANEIYTWALTGRAFNVMPPDSDF
jgi:hypothetical protein